MSYPAVCQNCPVKDCKDAFYRVRPFVAYRHPGLIANTNYGKDGRKAGIILVLLSEPNEQGAWYDMSEASEFLTQCLGDIEVPWALTGALRCNSTNGNFTKKHLEQYRVACTTAFLGQDMDAAESGASAFLGVAAEVACIVAVGMDAFKTLFPTSALTLDRAKQGVHTYKAPAFEDTPEWEVPVLVTNHPSVHFMPWGKGGKDLRPEYDLVFSMAESIALGTSAIDVKHEEIGFTDLDGFKRAYRWAHDRGFGVAEYVAFDLEVDVNERDPKKMTVYHPEAKILSVQMAWKTSAESDTVYSFSVRTTEFDPINIYGWVCMFLKNKSIDGSNLYFDLSVLCWANGHGGCEEAESRLLKFATEIIIGQDDLWLWGFCQDQGQVGNGLKSRYTKLFRQPDFSVEMTDAYQRALKEDPLAGYGHPTIDPDMRDRYGRHDVFATTLVCWHDRKHTSDPNHPRAGIYQQLLEESLAAASMSIRGTPVSPSYFVPLKDQLEKEIVELQTWLNSHPFGKLVGNDVNPKSPQKMTKIMEVCRTLDPQIADIVQEKTESGLWELDKKVLKRVCKVPGNVAGFWRTIQKARSKKDLISKFIDPPMTYAIPEGENHLIHAMFQIAKADTMDLSDFDFGTIGVDSGRWSSTPNMQNVIKDTLIRSGYVGYKDAQGNEYVLVNKDYKSIEPVTNAWVSKCRPLMDMFLLGVREPKNPNADIYSVLGSPAFGVPPEVIFNDKTFRDPSKVLVLAITYNMFPETLAAMLGISVEDAEQMMRGIYGKFPELLAREARTRKLVFEGKPVETVVGSVQTFPLDHLYDYDHDTMQHLPFWQLARLLNIRPMDAHRLRKACNFEIQGPASKLVTLVLSNLFYIRAAHEGWRQNVVPIGNNHDAILALMRRKTWREYSPKLSAMMRDLTILKAAGCRFGFTEKENPLRDDTAVGLHLGAMVEPEAFVG